MLRRILHSLAPVLFAALCALALSSPAGAACSNPAGAKAKVIYNTTSQRFQYCDDINWIAMTAPGSGAGGCANPARADATIIYNSSARLMQGCAGDSWRAMGPVGGAGEWAQVSAGDQQSCGIKTDGTLWCWGSDSDGELGNGGVTGTQISPSQESTAATDWASVSAGSTHTCAVKTSGALWCWGTDSFGELGNGAGGSTTSPSQESTAATDWASVEAGTSHTCAVKTSGALWCWGSDSNGQLGNGGVTGDQISPSQESTAATNWASVAAGDLHTCAVKTSGALWCWGTDNFGRLGNGGVTGDQISPSQESTAATNWASVSAGNSHTCAVKTTGTLWCWGADNNSQLGNGGITGSQISPSQESTAATDGASVSAGLNHTCAVKTSGVLWCWGSDISGQLGNGLLTGNQDSPTLESTAATDWASVAAGGSAHTCAVKTSGALWCWGSDSNGELGNGGVTGDQNSPSQESTAATDWVSLAAGNAHTCAVKSGGTLWCWGDDNNGALGDGGAASNTTSPSQESTLATDWVSVTAANQHSCGIKTDGTLWCWGNDTDGQLGNGGVTGNQFSPSQESTLAADWVSVDAGNSFTCAVKSGGTLWCWGDDNNGQLGNGGVTGDQISPSQESTLATDWSSVTAGVGHACAVKSGGTLWCWGVDSNGQLGNGGVTGTQISPSQESTAATDWASVAAGNTHTCAVKSGGTLWCWGADSNGRLGNGAITGTQISPSQESTAATNWASVSAGNPHTCAVKSSGALLCWGSNTTGQLGAGIPLGDSPVKNIECMNPQRYEGTLLYNSSSDVMQYCDGVSWVAIGK